MDRKCKQKCLISLQFVKKNASIRSFSTKIDAGCATSRATLRFDTGCATSRATLLRLTPTNVTGNPFLPVPATFDPHKRDRQLFLHEPGSRAAEDRPARQRFDARERLRSASAGEWRAALAYYLAGSANRTAPLRLRTSGRLF